MEIKEALTKWVSKYKYVAIILLIGVILMCIPGKDPAQSKPQETAPAQQQVSAEERLEAILSQLSGAGRVRVMLTVAEGEKTIYQFNEDHDTGDSSSSVSKDTVTVTDSNRNEQAVISQVLPPVYLGAVILCQGADQPAVRLAVVEAVSKLTGLGADKICVLKMK